MKKINPLSSFAVLFVLAAMTPQSVWSKACDPNNRKPASADLNCLKEEKDKLEKEVKKLVEDKQAVLKEIDEVKALLKNKEENDKKEAKKEKSDRKLEASEEIVDIMSVMTNLMLSQQQQQTMMMNQMFSLMSQSMQQFTYPQYDFQYEAKWNPYSLESLGNGFGYHQAKLNPYSIESLGEGFGIGLSHVSDKHIINPYQWPDLVKTPYRYPAQQPMQLDRQQMIMQQPIHGYDFGSPVQSAPEQKPQPQLQPQRILKA